MKRVALLLVSAVLCLLWLTARIHASAHGLFELTAHFKLHYLCIALAGAFLAWRMKHRVPLVLFLVALLLHGAEVSALYLPVDQPMDTPHAFKAISFNLRAGNQATEEVLAWVRSEDPDLAVFQEAHWHWPQALAGLRDRMPHVLGPPVTRQSGIIVYSRFPVSNIEAITLSLERKPGFRLVVDSPGGPLELVTLHPPAPHPRHAWINRGDLDRAARALERHPPDLVLGDLNTTPWAPRFRALLAGPLRQARQGQGLHGTYTRSFRYLRVAPLNRALALPIDHALVGDRIAVWDLRTGPYLGSDHLPLVIELGIPDGATR